ncbi:MAG: protein kinase [Chloroflexi bacterium]|uniref:protein kinase domain-containing protein n=1 Tax=Candidatus Flexifilum breve TaxID=3140694 RepID=UPI0031346A77|nr:protein kinase [Chloroflexota bacterium]
MSSLEGQTLGQYRVIAQMGHGGMATVFKGYHPRLDRFVAIKMMHQAFQEDKNFLARFEREAQIVARLDHPHIVPVFDFADFEGRPYLVMKYIEGRTLKGVLEDQPLAMGDILNLMPRIADALDYAHRQGVLHRDIKPSNIIIDVNGTPFLTDFGLARMAQLGESTLSHDMLLGTPHYISPEQAMGSRELDNRTDIYSLGVVLYELVVGRVPFSADTPFAIIHDHIYRPLPEPMKVNPEITPEVSAVLEKALAKSPADRYATATELVNAFKAAVETSGMATLNPNRVNIASDSLLEMRRAEDNATELLSNVGKPKRDRAASIPAAGPVPPTPQVPPAAPEPPKRVVVESSFDFADVGKAIEKAGEAIGDAFESWNEKNIEYELAPYETEETFRKRIEARFKKRGEFTGHLIAYIVVNALLWIIFSAAGGFSFISTDQQFLQWMEFPWPMIVSLGWGAGLAAHLFETHFATGSRDERRYQAIRAELRRQYPDGWGRVDRRELKKIRRRVEKPFKKRAEFFEHAAVYIMINAMLWLIFFFGSSVPDIGAVMNEIPFPWPLIVSLGWGVGLAINFAEMVTTSGRERAIQRAIEQEYGRKRKNDEYVAEDDDELLDSRPARRVRLTEDGELTDSMVVEWEEEDKPKRSRR